MLSWCWCCRCFVVVFVCVSAGGDVGVDVVFPAVRDCGTPAKRTRNEQRQADNYDKNGESEANHE